ncbi:MAG TPA: ABC transporter permease subunit [Verrucomicrobiae bacterium]|nr:ABC transporter permease subunit [Verrucomicrobiae bacterium]
MSTAQSIYPPVQAIAAVVIRELYRRKDFYVLFVLTALITLVLGSVNFFSEEKVVRYLKEICLFLIWVSSIVIAITTAARQIPAERENRTLFPLLAKPVTRNHVVLGKFLGCWYASGLCLFVFYLFFAVISGAREHAWPIAHYFQGFMLHWFLLGVVTALALLGSIVFAAPSSNNTITLVVVTGILLLAGHLNKMALNLSEPMHTLVYAIYYALPHLEFFDMRELIIHSRPTVPWLIWLAALLYATVYAAIFLSATCFLFRKKAIN